MSPKIKIKRIPNSYYTSKDIRRYESNDGLMVVDDQDFVDCVVGTKDELPLASKQRVLKSMNGYKAKMELFLAAYAQKNASRLSKILRAIDTVDGELFQEWRLRSMDGETLAKIMAGLLGEKSRLSSEIRGILDRFDVKEIPDLDKLETKPESVQEVAYVEVGEKVKEMSPSSRKKVTNMLKKIGLPVKK